MAGSKKVSQFHIVEIERGQVPVLDVAAAAAVSTLEHHPGFQWLLAKLAAERFALKDALEKTRHKSKEDFEFLQSGANWCNWLKTQLEQALAVKNRPVERQATSFEQQAFEQILGQIDVVGRSSQVTTPENAGLPQGER
jgi:hypothetical protein